MFKWRLRRMWPVAVEAVISIVWAYVIFGIFILYLYGLFSICQRMVYSDHFTAVVWRHFRAYLFNSILC